MTTRVHTDDLIRQRDQLLKEKHDLESRYNASIGKYEKLLMEFADARQTLTRAQQQRDEYRQEMTQVVSARLKVTKELARMTEERNVAVHEYNLIMSERDSVHKEIEKLQEELAEAQKRADLLQDEKKRNLEQIENLKRDMANMILDSYKLSQKYLELKEKYGELSDEASSPTSPVRIAPGQNRWDSCSSGISSSWKQSSVLSNLSQQHFKAFGSKMDNFEQMNLELETLRRQNDQLNQELKVLLKNQQDMDKIKKERDWALSDRDKIVKERESIKILCDNLRRERDRVVNDLAEAVRNSDDVERQRDDIQRELRELKERFESKFEQNHVNSREPSYSSLSLSLSSPNRDSTTRQASDRSNNAPTPPPPTLLDRAYNQIFGDFKTKPSLPSYNPSSEEHYAIARFDRVLGTHVGSNRNYANTKQQNQQKVESKEQHQQKSKQLKKDKGKNGGTWPKYHGPALILSNGNAESATGAVNALHSMRRKDRKSIAIFNPSYKPTSDKSTSVSQYQVSSSSKSTSSKEKFLSNYSIYDTNDCHKLSTSAVNAIAPTVPLSGGHQRSSSAHTSTSHHHLLHSHVNHPPHHCVIDSRSTAATGSKSASGAVMCTVVASNLNNHQNDNLQNDTKFLRARPNKVESSLDYSIATFNAPEANFIELCKNRPHSVHDVPTDALDRNPSTCNSTVSGSVATSISSTPSTPAASGSVYPVVFEKNAKAVSLSKSSSSFDPNIKRCFTMLSSHDQQNNNIVYSSSGLPRSGLSTPSERCSSTSPHSAITNCGPRNGLELSDNKYSHYLTSTEHGHGRSFSAYQPSKVLTSRDSNRYNITPSPSPSTGSPVVSNATKQIPSNSDEYHKRLASTSLHSALSTSPTTINANSGYKSDENDGSLIACDGLSTFPKRSQRIRMPSNQSVISKSSGGKLSTESIDKTSLSAVSDRSSPVTFTVEWMLPRGAPISKDTKNFKPKPGDVRYIEIMRSSGPLGINISCKSIGKPDTRCVFVSSVEANSLAYQAGITVGDQVLEICGINMRNATFDHAANVLRQCGDRLTLLLQYSPSKMHPERSSYGEKEGEADEVSPELSISEDALRG